MRPNPARIIDLANAFYDSNVLFTASDLGVFAALQELNSADAQTLATKLGLDLRGIRLLLDGCVAIGLLQKTGEAYANTDEAQTFLVPGQPGDLTKAIRYNRDVYNAWGDLTRFVQFGDPVERPEVHLGDDKDRTRTFVLSMHGRALGIGQAVVPQLKLGDCKKILDVGGGPGTYSVLIAKNNPGLSSTVMDLPGVVAIASELIEKQGMSDRVATLPGSYRTDPFPGDQDAVLFFGMLHQESPESIQNLMKKAYAALKPGGIVYVMDMMTDQTHTEPKFSALFAVNMALTTENGWVFSDLELKTWMEEAGFTDFEVSPLAPPMPHWLAFARKA